MNIRRILVPYDFTNCSGAALDYAAQFATQFDARIYVVHVDELLDARISAIPPMSDPNWRDSSWDRRRCKVKKKLTGIMPHNTATVYEHHCLIGAPADEILAFAERTNTDLIVIGSHGRTGASRLFAGSVAEAVVRRSKCPVLVVKSLDRHHSTSTNDTSESTIRRTRNDIVTQIESQMNKRTDLWSQQLANPPSP